MNVHAWEAGDQWRRRDGRKEGRGEHGPIVAPRRPPPPNPPTLFSAVQDSNAIREEGGDPS